MKGVGGGRMMVDADAGEDSDADHSADTASELRVAAGQRQPRDDGAMGELRAGVHASTTNRAVHGATAIVVRPVAWCHGRCGVTNRPW